MAHLLSKNKQKAPNSLADIWKTLQRQNAAEKGEFNPYGSNLTKYPRTTDSQFLNRWTFGKVPTLNGKSKEIISLSPEEWKKSSAETLVGRAGAKPWKQLQFGTEMDLQHPLVALVAIPPLPSPPAQAAMEKGNFSQNFRVKSPLEDGKLCRNRFKLSFYPCRSVQRSRWFISALVCVASPVSKCFSNTWDTQLHFQINA